MSDVKLLVEVQVFDGGDAFRKSNVVGKHNVVREDNIVGEHNVAGGRDVVGECNVVVGKHRRG